MLRVKNMNRQFVGFSCLTLFIYTSIFKANVVSSEKFHSLVQNPGIGVNFYGKTENNGSTPKNIYGNSDQGNCMNCSKNSMYQDPGLICEIQDPVQCNYSYPYRTYDGTCNNPRISRLGMTKQCYLRFTPPYYQGLGGFRKSVKGGPLPQPRHISLKIFKDIHRPTNTSFQFAIFGQFLASDVVASVLPSIDCCSEENANNPKCKPISISPDDPFYSQFNKTCIDFKRAAACLCKTTKRAQQNGATSAIDFSHLYSVSEDTVMEIRALDGTGKLKTTETSAGILPPPLKHPEDGFCSKLKEDCFKIGDPRMNHHTSLASMVTIFTREHNRIASILKQINPQWGEEKLFQETRKIVIAEFQKIVFKDYLPILVSPNIVEKFNMTVQNGAKGIYYDPSVILGMWNEFAIASFRLHSTVPTNIGSLNLRFKDTFGNFNIIRQGHLSDFLKGLQIAPTEKFDRYMVTDLTNFLNQLPGMAYGQDLAAINIQRGRDHGLAPYVDVVKFCSDGKILISSFDDLFNFGLMSEANANLLKQIYAAVEDVEMWVGMQLEYLMPGAVTGPSAVCMNVKQLYFNQKGDRFYFDLEGPEAPFTAAQRRSLKQSSFARIICDNTEIDEVAKNPFLLPNAENSLMSCNEVPEVDLLLWKEPGDKSSAS